eukprot:4284172-Pyramimonas_sp.AAC.1
MDLASEAPITSRLACRPGGLPLGLESEFMATKLGLLEVPPLGPEDSSFLASPPAPRPRA